MKQEIVLKKVYAAGIVNSNGLGKALLLLTLLQKVKNY